MNKNILLDPAQLPNESEISEIYAFLTIDEKGNEGIFSVKMPNNHHMPAVFSKERMINLFIPFIEEALKLTDQKIKVRLVKFSNKEVLKTIEK